MVVGLVAALVAGITAFACGWLLVRHAAALDLVQVPNERSSHTVPTPGAGGIGIVLGATIGAIPAALVAPWPTAPVAGLAVVLGLVGLLDDRRPVAAPLRLAVHLAVAAALVGVLAPLPSAQPAMAMLGSAAVVVAIAFWVNAFNFMDGIDGLAAAQASFMFAGAALLAVVARPELAEHALLWWMLSAGAASAGFLCLNWPPAKIFMGDVGSTCLGFLLAALALLTVLAGWLSIWQWLILAGLFLLDTVLTLARRAWRREPILSAHRLHAYQHLSRRWASHRCVTLLYLAINVLWLLPLAWSAGVVSGAGWMLAAVAALPLVPGLLFAGAGAPEARPADGRVRTSS